MTYKPPKRKVRAGAPAPRRHRLVIEVETDLHRLSVGEAADVLLKSGLTTLEFRSAMGSLWIADIRPMKRRPKIVGMNS